MPTMNQDSCKALRTTNGIGQSSIFKRLSIKQENQVHKWKISIERKKCSGRVKHVVLQECKEIAQPRLRLPVKASCQRMETNLWELE